MKKEKKQLLYLIHLFLFLAAGITAGGVFYYRYEAEFQKKRAFKELEAIADFKAREISLWRRERLGDADVLSANPFIKDQLSQFLLKGIEGEDALSLRQYLDKVAEVYSYRSWVVFNAAQHHVLSSGKASSVILAHHSSFWEKSLQHPFFSDLHVEKNGNVDIDLAVPIILDESQFLIVFQIDPNDYLYPLIQTWPSASVSAETMLVEREGDEILILNKLRRRDGTVLKSRLSVREDIPAVMAADKISTSMEGRDYRGIPVLAVTRPVEGTNWGLAAKINVEEVLSPLYSRLIFVVVSSFLLISVSGVAILFLWQRQKNSILLSESEKYRVVAEELRSLTVMQKAILDNAGYSIISTTTDGIITTFNHAAENMLGYKADEVVGKATLEIIHDPVEIRQRAKLFSQQLGKKISIGFETFVVRARLNLDNEYEWTYIRKNGSRFLVLLSVTALRDANRNITGFLGMAADLSPLKEVEKNLQTIINSSPYGIAVTNYNGDCILANESLARIVGASREQILKQNFRELSTWQKTGLKEKAEETLKTDKTNELETHFTTSFGRNLWLKAIFVSIMIAGEKHLLAMFEDISERKATEVALKREKETVQAYFDAAGVMFLVLDNEGKVVRINKRGCIILGYEESEIVGENWIDNFVPQEVRYKLGKLFRESVEGKREVPRHFENSVLTRSGEERIISWNNIILYDSEGRIEAVLSSGEDVTERRRTEQEYKTILETAMDCFWITDSKGCFLVVNEAYCRLTGYSAEELLTMCIKDVEALESSEETVKHIEKVIREGYDRFESKHRCKDGSIIDVEISAKFVTINGGRFYVFLRDITAHNMAKKALVKARDEAEAANRAKSEFLANMSHEIRTPMTSILGMAELLSETELDNEQKEYLERLSTSSDALLAIINDILDLSKIEAGQFKLEEIDFNLGSVLDKVISIFQVEADRKGIRIIKNIPPSIPKHFIGDPIRMRQVLVNVIGNALKFTDSGKIEIKARVKEFEKRQDTCRLHLSVKDTGIGIEPEKLELIFKEFVQSDASTTRLYGGTGLGLTISKKLVNLMRGEIRAESVLGKGSTFHITVDLKKSLGKAAETAYVDTRESGPIKSKAIFRILLVEDSEDNRLLVKAFLKGTPHSIDMAENGEKAFELFTSVKYDLLLMDMQMPVMDGYETTRIIRKWEEERQLDQTPIVAFTAHALKEEVDQCLKAGCNEHIAKPIQKKKLMETLYKYGLSKTRQKAFS